MSPGMRKVSVGLNSELSPKPVPDKIRGYGTVTPRFKGYDAMTIDEIIAEKSDLAAKVLALFQYQTFLEKAERHLSVRRVARDAMLDLAEELDAADMIVSKACCICGLVDVGSAWVGMGSGKIAHTTCWRASEADKQDRTQ